MIIYEYVSTSTLPLPHSRWLNAHIELGRSSETGRKIIIRECSYLRKITLLNDRFRQWTVDSGQWSGRSQTQVYSYNRNVVHTN